MPPLRALPLACALALVGCGASPGEDIGRAAAALATVHVTTTTTISYAPNSYVIGNAYDGWTDVIQGSPQFSKGPGNPDGTYYRWGYLYGEGFDRCAWVGNGTLTTAPSEPGDMCGDPQEIDTPYFMSTFTNGMHNDLAGDGSETHMHYSGSGCTNTSGYGNVEPWRLPATPENSVGQVPDGKLLLWRYVSRDGLWVLVRDPAPPAHQPNWYFVHRGCVSLANVN